MHIVHNKPTYSFTVTVLSQMFSSHHVLTHYSQWEFSCPGFAKMYGKV